MDMTADEESGDRLRLCMVVHAYYPLGETRVEREALALRDRGLSVEVICLRKPGELAFEVIDGVRIHRLPIQRNKARGVMGQLLEYLAFFIMATWRLLWLGCRKRFDIIQVHNLPDFLVFATVVPKCLGARIILDLHDLMPEFFMERFHKSATSPAVKLVRWQEKVSCRFADHIITVTELWRQALIHRGVPPEKVTVVMNVADHRVFHASLRRREPVGSGHLRMLYHGSITHRYGLDLALLALDEVRREIPDVTLTIHGRGEYLDELQEIARDLGLLEHVSFSSQFMPTDELASFISQADLALVPYRDGIFSGAILPTKLMEYAALHMPVITSRTAAISTYFDDSMVEYFNPGDPSGLARCILGLVRDRSRLRQLGDNIAKFNQRHNWVQQSASYVDLILGMAAKRG
jgi:glycosyltransferase involved in cell wall biosynthesis